VVGSSNHVTGEYIMKFNLFEFIQDYEMKEEIDYRDLIVPLRYNTKKDGEAFNELLKEEKDYIL
jgi:hypothetical protein